MQLLVALLSFAAELPHCRRCALTRMHTDTRTYARAHTHTHTHTHIPQYTLSLPFLLQRKVVTLVKENKKATTLSIGDGANDVGMIKGVCGGEWAARSVWSPVPWGGGVGGQDCVVTSALYI